MSVDSTPSGWSDDLRAQTREVIEGYDIFASLDGQVHLKHAASARGVIAVDDLVRGVLRVVDRRTRAETTFASVEELIAAGWVID